MKVLLQQTTTGFFVGAAAPLVLEQKEARIFGGSLEAIDYCVAEGIQDVEVVLKFSESKYDIRLRPFGAPEVRERARHFASNAERLACLNEEIRKRLDQAKQTCATIESLLADGKERRKAYEFKPFKLRTKPKK